MSCRRNALLAVLNLIAVTLVASGCPGDDENTALIAEGVYSVERSSKVKLEAYYFGGDHQVTPALAYGDYWAPEELPQAVEELTLQFDRGENENDLLTVFIKEGTTYREGIPIPFNTDERTGSVLTDASHEALASGCVLWLKQSIAVKFADDFGDELVLEHKYVWHYDSIHDSSQSCTPILENLAVEFGALSNPLSIEHPIYRIFIASGLLALDRMKDLHAMSVTFQSIGTRVDQQHPALTQ